MPAWQSHPAKPHLIVHSVQSGLTVWRTQFLWKSNKVVPSHITDFISCNVVHCLWPVTMCGLNFMCTQVLCHRWQLDAKSQLEKKRLLMLVVWEYSVKEIIALCSRSLLERLNILNMSSSLPAIYIQKWVPLNSCMEMGNLHYVF